MFKNERLFFIQFLITFVPDQTLATPFFEPLILIEDSIPKIPKGGYQIMLQPHQNLFPAVLFV